MSLIRLGMCFALHPHEGRTCGCGRTEGQFFNWDHCTPLAGDKEAFSSRCKFKWRGLRKFLVFVFFFLSLLSCFVRKSDLLPWKSCGGHTGSLGDVPGSEYFLLLAAPLPVVPPIASLSDLGLGWGSEPWKVRDVGPWCDGIAIGIRKLSFFLFFYVLFLAALSPHCCMGFR